MHPKFHQKNNSSASKLLQLFVIMLLTFLIAGTILYCGRKKDYPYSGYLTDSVDSILRRINVSRGICVVLGDTLCEKSRKMAMNSELLMYVQLQRTKDVEAARRAADADGLYGTRIYIERGDYIKVHLGDNLADALIAIGEATRIPKNEALRVLRPYGKALIGEKEWTKPYPEGADDWSHPYHGPDNNTQSNDRIAKAPYLTQFLAEPRYAPLPQVAVASAGRVFKGFGNIAFHEREEPLLNTLVAFNGYNGTVLWKRDLVSGIMLHRNTIIATPSILYLGGDKSCKLIDTETGEIKGEMIAPLEVAGGTFWKWMGMENGILYALLGEQEYKDAVMRWKKQLHGWPWYAISKGFNQPEHLWGFGRDLLAINPKKKKILWHHREEEPIDSRALCMKNGRIYIYRFGSFLACLNTKNGKTIWRKTPENAQELFKTLGTYSNRQGYQTNWRTTAYLKCSDEALYFAGPQVDKLLALSTQDGSILWENPYDNFQILLRDEGLYAISGPWNDKESRKFDPLTGQVLAELATGRRACTRPTGSVDAIFYRAQGGTVRFDIASDSQQWISPMRPNCHDGVTIANGLLYWWPSVCDCQLSIYGVTCLGPARDFEFNQLATEAERLEINSADLPGSASVSASADDWPSFRRDAKCSATTNAIIPKQVIRLWRYSRERDKLAASASEIMGGSYYIFSTAPVVAGGAVFFSGSDGIVRALNAENGMPLWVAYTGGAVRFPPTIWDDRVLVGSGDGWIYNFEAGTGRVKWRFRAAPVERKIAVYGSLLSTWPVASGVLVADGIAYAAAGILNYDGTYVYALDAKTGKIKWQNNTSGHLDPTSRTGASVQGHMLLHNGKLYLASGNALSPAVYDIRDGRCLNDPKSLEQCESSSPRGWELSLMGDNVIALGQPFYGHPDYPVYDASVVNKMFIVANGDRDIIWVNNQKISYHDKIDRQLLNKEIIKVRERIHTDWKNIRFDWRKLDIPQLERSFWELYCEGSVALVLGQNAVVIAKESELMAISVEEGKILWIQPLYSPPVPWGLAVDCDGRVIVALENGDILCYGQRRNSMAKS